MSSKFSKILTIVVLIIGLIGLFFYVRVLMAGDDAIKESADLQNSIISPFIWLTIIVLAITIGSSLISSLFGLVKNPENLKKALLGVGSLAILLVISYILGDSNAVLDSQGMVIEGGEAGAAGNQWVGSLIWLSSILAIIGGIFFVYDLIKGLIKS